jgi:hypothetical protein
MADKDPLDEFMALPRDQQLATLQQLPAPTQDKILGEVKTRITGLSVNPNKNGIYAMQDENGNQLGISFDKVDEAGKYGFKFPTKVTIPNAKSREDYAKDRFAILQPNASAPSVGTRGNLLEGRFTKGGKIVPQTPIPEQVPEEPGAWQGAREAFQGAAVPTGENRPVSLGKTKSLVDSAWNLGANFLDKVGNTLGVAANTVFGAADMVPQIVGASKDALSYDPYKATTGLATLMQMMPPLMAKNYVDHLKAVHKDNPAYATDDVIGTVMGIWASGKLAERATKAVSDPVGTLKSLKETPGKLARVTAEAVTRTGPREIKRMAEELQKANAAATEAHQNVVQPNAENLVGDEIAHHADEKIANEKAAAEHQTKQENARAKNKKTIEDHQKEVADVQAHNDRVKAKHEETARKIQEERDAAEHALDLRRTEEAKLQKETDDYFAKEEAVKAKVKANADTKWQPVHKALDAETIDGGDIEKPLAKIIEISPEVRREINQLIPDPADVDPESNYGKERQRVMESNGYPKGTNYFDLPEPKRIDIDKMTASSGFTPEPIDFDPKVGVGVPFDKVHRAQSVIGRNIREGRYGFEGTLRGEMERLQQILYDAENKIAANNGKTADLNAARQATREYKEAFGIEKNRPQSNLEKREQEVNPDQYKEKKEQKRVDAAAKHDPTLASDYEKVKAHREQIKKQMKTEEQLRASLRPVPEPPSVGDLREGYNLKEPPSNPVTTRRDAQGNLLQLDPKTNTWSPAPETGIQRQLDEVPPDRLFTVQDTNGNVQKLVNGKWETIPNPRPQNLAHPTPESVQLERPIAGNLPDRPEPGTITPEGYKTRVETNIGKAAESQREHGLRRATNALYYTIPTAIFSAIMSHPGYAIAELASTPAILGGSHLVANLIEKPEVVQWLSSVTDRHVAVWDKLPPEQKALFSDDMKQLIEAARKKGVKVSPALTKFVSKPVVKAGIGAAGGYAGAANANRPSVEELKRQAEELQKKFSGGTPPPPGPQSSNKKTVLSPQELLTRAQELQGAFHKAGMSPQPPPPAYTHVYDESSGRIVPV